MRTPTLPAILALAVLFSSCGGGSSPQVQPTTLGQSVQDSVTGNGLLGQFGQQTQLTCLMFPSSVGCIHNTGFSQTYTASLQAGEVLQFSVDTTHFSYSYTIVQSSYGVPLGQSGTGAVIAQDPDGSYELGASTDNFVQSGYVFPVQNGLMVGHLAVSVIGGARKIPIFGVSSLITAAADGAGTYNYQGVSCNALSHGNPGGDVPCASMYGTLSVDGAGNVTQCKSGNIAACPTSTQKGVVTPTGTPGIFNFSKSGVHKGWFFAFLAPDGQKVVVFDRDDSSTPEYGHAVAVTQVSLASGDADGTYFTKNNFGETGTIVITGSTFTSTKHPGVIGNLTYNSPWTGMVRYTIDNDTSGTTMSSGTAMASGTGAYTHIKDQNPSEFAVGVRY